MIAKENFYLLLATFFWALGLIVGKFCSAEIPALTLTCLRYFIAGIGITIIYYSKKKEMKIDKKDLPYIIGLAFLGVVLNGVFFFMGIKITSSVNTAIISSTTPMIVCILGFIFFKEKVTKRNVLSVLMSVLGILFLLVNGDLSQLLNINFNKGDLIILGAVISNGIYIIGSKKMLKKYEIEKLLAYVFLITSFILSPALIFEKELYIISQISSKAILSLLYMAIFSSLLAFLLQQKGIKKLGPIKAAVYTNLIPIYSIILSCLILREQITFIQIISMFFVFLAIIINLKDKA